MTSFAPSAQKPRGANPLREALGACRTAWIALGVISFFISVLTLTVPLYTLQLFDRVISGRSVETLLYLSLVAVAALIALGSLEALRNRMLIRVSGWLGQRVGADALGKAVQYRALGGGYGAQVLRDLSQLRQFIASHGLIVLFDAPWVPIYLAVIFLLHPLLGAIAGAGALVLLALAWINEALTREPLRQASGARTQALRKVELALGQADSVEAMGLLPQVLRRWQSDDDASRDHSASAGNRAGAVAALAKSFRWMLQVAMLGAGTYLALEQQLTAGAMIAGSIILTRGLQPVESAIHGWKALVQARLALARLNEFFDHAPRRHVDIALPEPTGRLSVERLAFAGSERSTPILKGFSFELEAGQALAVIGPSGSGKSTLARLLVGIRKPTVGAVRLDGADVHAWERADFGRHVGYLPQDAALFEGTVAENIARLGEANPEAVVAAAQLAGAHEMILALPQGYRTPVGESGLPLSGGQRQLIALARAVFGRPRFVVLDEPNAGLDGEGERALARCLCRLRESGATVVLIAHRPSLVRQADRVLVLKEGAIEMCGTPADVLPRLGLASASLQRSIG
ncbi:hypothetical protein ABI59_15210 [Acidobacteria bacterium Mor1]|nr:hypothetical protein ABI59_15210 [Acidobacteria bacterium Mor1]